MLSRNTIALAAAAILATVSVAQANDRDDTAGGFRVGPLGQSFGGGAANPAYHRSMRGAGRAYAYVAPNFGNASCEQRFRSYDPASGTYLGFDGLRHPCP
jgi:hypothetical protein